MHNAQGGLCCRKMYTCPPFGIASKRLSSVQGFIYPVVVENSPVKQIYSPWTRTINSPSGGVPVLTTS